jgi:ABC-type amino acid transport substrate-binding protein
VNDERKFADVFLSYGHARREETASLAQFLDAAGFTTWWDSGLLPGDRFRDEIDEHLNGCRVVIIIWTPEAIRSDWVLAEADHAWHLKKLVNVHVPGIDPVQIPKPFNQNHSVEIANRAQIVEAIRKRIGGGAEAANASRGGSAPAVATPARQPAARRRHLLVVCAIAGVMMVAMVGGLLFGLRPGIQTAANVVPHWSFKGNLFVGQPIPLAWTYSPGGTGSNNTKTPLPVLFEIDSAADTAFKADSRVESYADGSHKFIGRVNATRFWRVRAVDGQSKKELSGWSDIAEVAQYESALDRIKATHKVLVYVSNAENQGFFKWVNDKGYQGFDVELAALIADALTKKFGATIAPVLVPVPWSDLLTTPAEGSADLLISSISKRDERKQQFRIDFSDTYYCATQALIFREGTPKGSIRDMVAGKSVGVQADTTTQKLANVMAEVDNFRVKAFDTTESLTSALLQYQVDFGLVDTPFAFVAQLQNRSGDRSLLSTKVLQGSDFPSAVPKEDQSEEYAIVVRHGEFDLLSLINQVIADAKQNGALPRLLDQAAHAYAGAFGTSADIEKGAERAAPWNCLR